MGCLWKHFALGTGLFCEFEFVHDKVISCVVIMNIDCRDELNLAPSDILEALNRLLDDNRELLIPETGEIVRPAPGFFLFATQNPPGAYGGRKPLSRAFRNR